MTLKAFKIQLALFFSVVFIIAAGASIQDSLFNNFLSDVFEMSTDHRGYLEFPRELPGFLVVLMTGLLCALPVTRIGAVGAGIFSLGMIGLAVFGFRFWPMVMMMMVTSAGMHLLQPVSSSIALALSNEKNRGIRLGQMGAVRTIGFILGAGVVWLTCDKVNPQYRVFFFGAGIVVGLGVIIYLLMHIPALHQPAPRLVYKKKFRLYYLLEFLFGARKQIFITFGLWVLIKIYDQPPTSIARLYLIASVIGIAFKPLAGMAIDRFGERKIMVLDGIVLAVVCIGYGYAYKFTGSMGVALIIVSVCFIADDLLFSLGTARAVYLSRMTDSPQEITSTLAMGVSINHIASMTIPAVAGLMWKFLGYELLFAAAACLAVSISFVSSFAKAKSS